MTYEQKLKQAHTGSGTPLPLVQWLEKLADTTETPNQLIKIYSIIKKQKQ